MHSTLLTFLAAICLVRAQGTKPNILNNNDHPPSQAKWKTLDIYEINDEMERASTPSKRGRSSSCPDMRTCGHECYMGHAVGEDGCEICGQCVTSGLMESDIIVDENSYEDVKRVYGGGGCDGRGQRGASRRAELEWPKTGKYVKIGYTFSHTVSNTKRANITKAFKEYARKTCIRFVPRTDEEDYIEFDGDESRGCSSYVGRQGRGKQPVTIGRNCDMRLGTIIHEIMHALGFWHEQSRGDRDNYITIKLENVRSNAKHNFQKRSRDEWDPYGSPFDTGSVMQYGGFFFSNARRYGEKPTIVHKHTNRPVVAQRDGFSVEDLRQINNKYKCEGYSSSGGHASSTEARNVAETTKATTEACKDDHTLCAFWQSENHCKTSSFVQRKCKRSCGICAGATSATVIARHLTRTTRKTTTAYVAPTPEPAECKDKGGSCEFWKRKNYCNEEFVGFMRSHCRATCGLCSNQADEVSAIRSSQCEDKHRSCLPWAEHGLCATGNYVTFMKKNCKRSCAKAGVGDWCQPQAPPTPPPTQASGAGCKDKLKKTDCRGWERQGFCRGSRHAEFMKRHCRRSCGLCGRSLTLVTPKQSAPSITEASTAQAPYKGCGVPEVNLEYRKEQRIVGGLNAEHGSIPWIVSLRMKPNTDFCGGALINDQFVVTAAHCFYDRVGRLIKNPVKKMFAFLGKHHRFSSEDEELNVSFSGVRLHSAYNHESSDYDIAIIKLSKPVTFTKFIKPVCLPSQGRSIKSETVALVSGWGDQERTFTDRSDFLQQVDVAVVGREECKKWFISRKRNPDHITDNMICAGYLKGGKDACQGDSGGPLTVPWVAEGDTVERHHLIGVVSWGYGCAEKSSPGIYTEVSKMIHWINKTIRQMRKSSSL